MNRYYKQLWKIGSLFFCFLFLFFFFALFFNDEGDLASRSKLAFIDSITLSVALNLLSLNALTLLRNFSG